MALGSGSTRRLRRPTPVHPRGRRPSPPATAPPPPALRPRRRPCAPAAAMGVQSFQDYIEKHCPSAVVPVELQKLAQSSLVGGGRRAAAAPADPAAPAGGRQLPAPPLRRLLHRLGQRRPVDHMLGYLAVLAKACFGGSIELFVFFNGALEKARLHEWVKR
ncbi:hypothetical protein P7K49_013172 [Saguinus oedipus]|uniref:Uncharacterized protein n=1 Tax=Saguinus oedipus TaxID=9490 RepID=A0ABQ9VI18_SAGOE|nr:hypothetical protein P7K49_013172 [Saguinus oedipus]